MSGLKDDKGRIAGMVLAVLLVGVAVAGVIYETQIAAPPAPKPAAQAAAPTVAGTPGAAAPIAPVPVTQECVLPGPVPALPRGEIATAEDMKTQHDAIQGFVKALEAYQACYHNKADHAPPGTEDRVKQGWIVEGDRAIDVAHRLADAFAEQLKLYHDKHPDAPPIEK
jgi:hypothetical protein